MISSIPSSAGSLALAWTDALPDACYASYSVRARVTRSNTRAVVDPTPLLDTRPTLGTSNPCVVDYDMVTKPSKFSFRSGLSCSFSVQSRRHHRNNSETREARRMIGSPWGRCRACCPLPAHIWGPDTCVCVCVCVVQWACEMPNVVAKVRASQRTFFLWSTKTRKKRPPRLREASTSYFVRRRSTAHTQARYHIPSRSLTTMSVLS